MLAHHFSLASRICFEGAVLILLQIKDNKLLKALEKCNPSTFLKNYPRKYTLLSKSFLRLTEFYEHFADEIRARILEICT